MPKALAASAAGACIFVAAVVAAVLAMSGAGGEELLTNRGFETGDVTGWTVIDATLSVEDIAFDGNYGATITTPQGETTATISQTVAINEGQAYEFSAYAFANNPAIDRLYLRIEWLDGGTIAGDDVPMSDWLIGDVAQFRRVSTGSRFAPIGVDSARLSLIVATSASATLYADEFSFAGVPGVTPADTPTPSPTPTPSETPTPTPSETPTPTPAATAPASATPSPTSSTTPTPRATAVATPRPTPAEPVVFPALTNGGFEQLRDDDTAYGWHKIGGTLGYGETRRGGLRSLALTSETSSTKWAYQSISVRGGAYYVASVYAAQRNAAPGQLFLRISWYRTPDATGEAIASDDSPVVSQNGAFSQLITDPAEAPVDARSARMRLMFRPADASTATAYFDDATFIEVDAPVDTPAPTATPSPSPPEPPTPTALPTRTPHVTEEPTPTSATTATPTPTSAPTASPTAAPTPVEPEVFPALANGGFEDAREDGTPYAWHKIGGEIAVSNASRIEGDLALHLTSASESTKWGYQTVLVTPGAYYEASAWAMNTAPADELMLRISWYSSADASGMAIESADATQSVAGDAAGFRRLSTGAIQAPQAAHSARVRLLLRPASSAATGAFFDDVRFSETEEPAAVVTPTSAVSATVVTVAGAAAPAAVRTGAATPTPAVLGAAVTPVNVRPAANVFPSVNEDDSEGGLSDWLLGAAIGVPAIGIAGLLGADYVRGRRETDA